MTNPEATPTEAPVEAVAEAPETPAAEAPATEAPAETSAEATDESLSQIVQRHAEESVPKPEAEEEAPVEAVEETEEAPEQPLDEQKEETQGYTQEDIQTAIAIFEQGESHPDYETALEILDDMGMIEYEEDVPEEEPVKDPSEMTLEERLEAMERREYEREEAARADAEAEAAREADERAEREFFAELDQHFAEEGQEFPRDPNAWTDEQKLQASLTATYESAEIAKQALQSYVDSKISAYADSKADPVPTPEVGGASAESKEDSKSPREALAETAQRHMAAANGEIT